jgi:hypothetical protein
MNDIVALSVAVLVLPTIGQSEPASARTPQGVDLAKLKGWDIVVADDASAGETYAAREFQEFLNQANSVELPIAQRIDRVDRHVFIGPGKNYPPAT